MELTRRFRVTGVPKTIVNGSIEILGALPEDSFVRGVLGLPEVDFLQQNRIPFRFSLALEPGASLAADPFQLPLASQSVDLVVLPHVLEGHEHPHEVLRETERVLMPEGQVVISGFNPGSLWRLRQMFSGRHREAPWDLKFIGLLRLRDWLRVLGFELNGGKFGCYAPPFGEKLWLERFEFMMQDAEAAAASDRFIEDRSPRHLFDVLPEIADGDLLRHGDVAFVGSFFPDDHSEQRRLSRTIRADEPDFLAWVELERGIDEQGPPAEVLGDTAERDHEQRSVPSTFAEPWRFLTTARRAATLRPARSSCSACTGAARAASPGCCRRAAWPRPDRRCATGTTRAGTTRRWRWCG